MKFLKYTCAVAVFISFSSNAIYMQCQSHTIVVTETDPWGGTYQYAVEGRTCWEVYEEGDFGGGGPGGETGGGGPGGETGGGDGTTPPLQCSASNSISNATIEPNYFNEKSISGLGVMAMMAPSGEGGDCKFLDCEDDWPPEPPTQEWVTGTIGPLTWPEANALRKADTLAQNIMTTVGGIAFNGVLLVKGVEQIRSFLVSSGLSVSFLGLHLGLDYQGGDTLELSFSESGGKLTVRWVLKDAQGNVKKVSTLSKFCDE